MVEGTFTTLNLLKVMPAAKDAVPYRSPPAILLYAWTLGIFWTEIVIELQVSLALLRRALRRAQLREDLLEPLLFGAVLRIRLKRSLSTFCPFREERGFRQGSHLGKPG